MCVEVEERLRFRECAWNSNVVLWMQYPLNCLFQWSLLVSLFCKPSNPKATSHTSIDLQALMRVTCGCLIRRSIINMYFNTHSVHMTHPLSLSLCCYTFTLSCIPLPTLCTSRSGVPCHWRIRELPGWGGCSNEETWDCWETAGDTRTKGKQLMCY